MLRSLSSEHQLRRSRQTASRLFGAAWRAEHPEPPNCQILISSVIGQFSNHEMAAWRNGSACLSYLDSKTRLRVRVPW